MESSLNPVALRVLGGIAIFVFGALLTHFWNRYRNRLRELRWSVEYQRLAISGEDAIFGQVEVRYNQRPASNLHLAAIDLENQSNSDLSDVTVNIASQHGRILISHGQLAGSLQRLPFTDEFSSALNRDVDNLSPDEISYLTTRRDYLIPVLNRSALANFGLLLETETVEPPELTLACDHVGVRLTQEPAEEMFHGVARNKAAWLGLLMTLVLLVFLGAVTDSLWTIGIGAWLLGAFELLFGWAALRLWSWMKRILG